mmetsp:Transcript_25396/g.47948  ORF Transcript_25396/g.47948 Transcript_25396/m.47948 type:complete len:297 (-) Transcript_25396:523-1413(-)|eukprot:CAMPEP_0114225874 /NCGR_PEP_ID=MMETSP0058-20121206/920_1 /TAXON_ID=36894 /ORGANISM="Pyramimonas parkeae, CCMP726" /LENGTH=296 /DNA_ID=CAMNT_0001336539 /DNA_START=171 /DNA_END=1061 /DNA_ORIENTATION=+
MKREREPACPVCFHYHKWEQGEVCKTCGHRPSTPSERREPASTFPSEILPEFLYLGSYDNASRNELLKAIGVRCIVNTVPGCQNLYRNSFTYHSVPEPPPGTTRRPPLDECLEFIEESRLGGMKVLVHCMTGTSRSASVVVAYIMKHRNWSFHQSLEWVTKRRPCVRLTSDAVDHMREFELRLFGKNFEEVPLNQLQEQACAQPAPLQFGLPLTQPGPFNIFGTSSACPSASQQQQGIPPPPAQDPPPNPFSQAMSNPFAGNFSNLPNTGCGFVFGQAGAPSAGAPQSTSEDSMMD